MIIRLTLPETPNYTTPRGTIVVKNHGVVKTRSVWSFWDKSARCLMTGWTATGVEGA
jgi:hypothetical protein